MTRTRREAHDGETDHLDVEVLFQSVREPLAKRLAQCADECISMQVVAGFVTVDGVRSLASSLEVLVKKLDTLVVGAGTQRAFDAIDELVEAGLPRERVAIHLGHTRLTKPGSKHQFYRYHPMLHSKIYLFDMPDARSVAVVGSHNLTSFAMLGLNGEASIMLTGPSSHPELSKIRAHIAEAKAESRPYTSHIKDGYAWWTSQLLQGMAEGALDRRKNWKRSPTVILLVEGARMRPQKGDKLYFELPRVLKQRVLNAEVHVYIFDRLPQNPMAALDSRGAARSVWGKIRGLEDDQGGLEFDVDWHVTTDDRPSIKKAEKPFRPDALKGFQQVRVELCTKSEAILSICSQARRTRGYLRRQPNQRLGLGHLNRPFSSRWHSSHRSTSTGTRW